jgi:flagellar assembly factor FliW
MRADHDPELRLYLVDPQSVVSEYAPILTDEQAEALTLGSADDALILVVAHPSSDGVSVNLLAPVIVNRTTGAAAQVILEDQDYPLRAPLG